MKGHDFGGNPAAPTKSDSGNGLQCLRKPFYSRIGKAVGFNFLSKEVNETWS